MIKPRRTRNYFPVEELHFARNQFLHAARVKSSRSCKLRGVFSSFPRERPVLGFTEYR